MGKGRRLPLLIVLLTSILITDWGYAGGGPKNVLLVVNDASPVSQSIAAYYKEKRRIPERNVCHIWCSTSESVGKAECEADIVTPIRTFLSDPALHDRIDYVVLTKGIPLKASYFDSTSYGPLSVASVLSCVGVPSIANACTNPYGPTAYPTAPNQYFTHRMVFSGKSYYAVSRLDAYTEGQVCAMIDSSLSAQPRTSVFVLDGRQENDPASNNYKANNRLRQANHDLLTAGFSTYYDDTSFDAMINGFAEGQQSVMAYFSWGSNEASYALGGYQSNQFAPGSIADTFVSSSVRSFAYPPTYGQSLISDLIPQGLSGGCGYVSEPDIRYATYPNVLFSRYIQGYNMAECFLAATPRLYWKSAVIGDPLMSPYATPPIVSILSPADSVPVHGIVKITANATDASGIKTVEAYVDDAMIGSLNSPPYEFSWLTANCSEGVHTVEVIAYENSPVCTQAMASRQIEVRNIPLDVSTIGGMVSIPDGRLVRLRSKVVTAGTDVFSDGAYISEPDRSAGIRVIGTLNLATGAVVTVEGDIGTLDGERVIHASSVVDASPIAGITPQSPAVSALVSAADALRPLAMANRYVANRGPNTGPEYAALMPGLSNVSLLVRTWGRVTSVQADEFSISDMSLDRRNALIREIKVSLRNMVTPIAPPPLDSYVMVQGVSCHTLEGGLRIPVIRPRTEADVVQVSP